MPNIDESATINLKRLAMQLAGQLPPDAKQSRQVIGYMIELVDWEIAPAGAAAVIRLVQGGG